MLTPNFKGGVILRTRDLVNLPGSSPVVLTVYTEEKAHYETIFITLPHRWFIRGLCQTDFWSLQKDTLVLDPGAKVQSAGRR